MVASWVRTQWRARGYHFERAARALRAVPPMSLSMTDEVRLITRTGHLVSLGPIKPYGPAALQGLFCWTTGAVLLERMGYGFIRLFGRRRSYGSTLPCELYHDRS